MYFQEMNQKVQPKTNFGFKSSNNLKGAENLLKLTIEIITSKRYQSHPGELKSCKITGENCKANYNSVSRRYTSIICPHHFILKAYKLNIAAL
jgi:hypothetical protein